MHEKVESIADLLGLETELKKKKKMIDEYWENSC